MSVAEYRRLQTAAPASRSAAHTAWVASICSATSLLGWRTLTIPKSMVGPDGRWMTATSVKGLPDILLWNLRGPGFAAIEAKTGTGTATPEQKAVLAELAAAGALTLVAHERDGIEPVKALLDVRFVHPG